MTMTSSNPKVHTLTRYPSGTPTWKVMMDYYEQVAKDAERLGKRFKAARFRKKATKTFIKAGGIIINL